MFKRLLIFILFFILLLIIMSPVFAEAESPKDIIEKRCVSCHDLDLIYNARKTRAEWKSTIDRMIGYGANLNKKEKETIINFLSGGVSTKE